MRSFGLAFFFLVLAASCGGKIDDGGTDGGVDSGPDSSPICKPMGSACNVSVDCCTGVCVQGVCATQPPPPKCMPDGAKCSANAQCCSMDCTSGGYCNGPQPPPPCKPDGVGCFGAAECCSYDCTNGICGGAPPPPIDAGPPPPIDGGIGCATTSNKKCDYCVAASCCSQMVSCENDPTCSNWLSCVQGCEQKGFSAFTCTGYNYCGSATGSTEYALYSCAQAYCGQPCTVD